MTVLMRAELAAEILRAVAQKAEAQASRRVAMAERAALPRPIAVRQEPAATKKMAVRPGPAVRRGPAVRPGPVDRAVRQAVAVVQLPAQAVVTTPTTVPATAAYWARARI